MTVNEWLGIAASAATLIILVALFIVAEERNL